MKNSVHEANVLDLPLPRMYSALCDIYSSQPLFAENLARPEILNLSIQQAGFLGVILKPLLRVSPAIWQKHHVVLHVTLVMMRIRDISSELIQLL